MYNCLMLNPRARRLIGLLILLISLGMLAWGLWPLGEVTRSFQILPTQMQLPTPVGAIFSWGWFI